VEVHASSDEVQRLEEEGFVVRERLLPPALLYELSEAADSIEAQELQTREVGQGSFGGLFTRNIVDRHPAFLKLLDYEPLLSVARLTLGPQVQLHGSVLRVSYPDLPGQGVEWHFHQRVVPDPLPSFFFRPVVLDNLIYLDDLTLEAGPLAVLPRTHLKDEDLPSGDNEDKPEQVVVTCPAGSVVTSHSGLWHKAFPTQANGGKRRLIIWGYSPVWMKQIDKPSAGAGYGLTDRLIANANEQTRELLGLSGYY
jgi:ectoine hydroxylase-related dioxygenase (phytanoyl-CoA dioxygenase family)